MSTVYIFKNLGELEIGLLAAHMPLIADGETTVVFIDDFTNLCEDDQECLLEFNPLEA